MGLQLPPVQVEAAGLGHGWSLDGRIRRLRQPDLRGKHGHRDETTQGADLLGGDRFAISVTRPLARTCTSMTDVGVDLVTSSPQARISLPVSQLGPFPC